MYTNITTI